MNFTKTQLILLGLAGFVMITLGLMLAGIIPGLKRNPNEPPKQTGTIEFWGVQDIPSNYDIAIQNWNVTYPGITIHYRNFDTVEEYKKALVESLAVGKGPDVFMVENNALVKDMGKIAPFPTTKFSVSALQQLFPQIVEHDFTSGGLVYALPASIDTLALIYNKDLFNAAGIVYPPATWEDFKTLIPKLVKKQSTTQLTQTAAAIGGSKKTISWPADIISLLMLQTGTNMVDRDFTGAGFSNEQGLNALNFYLQFSDASNDSYTWNDTLPKDLDAFSNEQVAMIFNYAAHIPEITTRNSFLNIGVIAMPQPKAALKPIAYARYYGYAVSAQSKLADLAQSFVIELTTDTRNSSVYAEATKKPPALLQFINQTINDGKNDATDVFARQALIARSWPQIDPSVIEDIFSNMINDILTGRTTIKNALDQAAGAITQLMQKKSF